MANVQDRSNVVGFKKSVVGMGKVADLEESNSVSVGTIEPEPVDELTLFGVVSPSSSEGDTIKDDIANELKRVRQGY